MREIVFDTETTGLDPLGGHRVVEIGCVELVNHIATGKTYHTYLNPQRLMPTEASMVHGLTDEFLADKSLFPEVVDDFLKFVGNSPIVAHNAGFDMKFINAELTRAGFPILPLDRAIDTVLMARKKFPGAPASLDALCKRFNVSLTERKLHGALLDARLLAEVYLELCGGRQPGLVMTEAAQVSESEAVSEGKREFRAARAHQPTEEELLAHEHFLVQIQDALWKRA